MAVNDSVSISKLRRLAWLLDSSIRVPGTRFSFGIDALIGLVPGLGDLIGTTFSAYIIAGAWRAGVSKAILAHMLFNVAVESIFGAVPLFGDVFDAIWKANQRNMRLIEGHTRDARRAKRSSLGFIAVLFLLLVAIVSGVTALVYFVFKALLAI